MRRASELGVQLLSYPPMKKSKEEYAKAGICAEISKQEDGYYVSDNYGAYISGPHSSLTLAVESINNELEIDPVGIDFTKSYRTTFII